jgi:hypothetical protein
VQWSNYIQSVKLHGSELEPAEDAHPAISVPKDLENLKRRFLCITILLKHQGREGIYSPLTLTPAVLCHALMTPGYSPTADAAYVDLLV